MIDMDKARLSARFGLTDDKRVVYVITHHEQYATELGFELAPVVVVFNPEHPLNPDDLRRGTIRKYTITRRHADVRVDLLAALAELQAKEPNWSGDKDCIRSSAGGSLYQLTQVMDIVHGHLL